MLKPMCCHNSPTLVGWFLIVVGIKSEKHFSKTEQIFWNSNRVTVAGYNWSTSILKFKELRLIFLINKKNEEYYWFFSLEK